MFTHDFNYNYCSSSCGCRPSVCKPCCPAPCPPPKPSCGCCCGDLRGPEGKSAYQIAVENGFIGTELQWLAGLRGATGPTGPSGPFLSSYLEALGDAQTVASGANIVFDQEDIDTVGNNIVLDSTGRIFTIRRTGLYHVEWSLNVAAAATGATTAVVGLMENGEVTSGASITSPGSFSGGALIMVNTVPFTLSLHNYSNEIRLENPPAGAIQWQNTAASIRIVRIADGPSV